MRSNRLIPVLGVLGALGAVSLATAAPPVFTGPTPYQSIADSPYFGFGMDCFEVEVFPGGVVSVPGYSFNSASGAAIIPGVGVPPGGHVLQANDLGVIEFSFDPPVNVAGFAWTGGDPIGSTITLTVIAGTEAITNQYSNLAPNDPNDPTDNRFFGVTWDVGIQILRVTFLPFGAGIPNQIDQIQFSSAASGCLLDQTDLNVDGIPDLVMQDTSTRAVSARLLAIDGGVAASNAVITSPANWRIGAVGPFDATTGFESIVLQNLVDRRVVAWLLGGPEGTDYVDWTPLQREGGDLLASPGWAIQGAADFDGDGDPDLLVRNESTGRLVIWEMNGLEYVGFHFVYSANTPLSWRVAGVHANGGRSVIVLQNQSSGQVIRWELVGFTYDNWAPYTRASDGTSLVAPSGWKVVGVRMFPGEQAPSMIVQSDAGPIVRWIFDAALEYIDWAEVDLDNPATLRVRPR